jgi:hypothetical protein
MIPWFWKLAKDRLMSGAPGGFMEVLVIGIVISIIVVKATP